MYVIISRSPRLAVCAATPLVAAMSCSAARPFAIAVAPAPAEALPSDIAELELLIIKKFWFDIASVIVCFQCIILNRLSSFD